jgi:RNA polymerase sigma factor (sigma-70 family)
MTAEKMQPLTKEQSELAAKNMPLVYWCAKRSRYWDSIIDKDGAISDMMLVLCKVARNHEPSRGTFSTYAVASLMKIVATFRRKERKRRTRARSLTPFLRDQEGVDSPLSIEDPQGGTPATYAVEDFRNLRRRLLYREHLVIVNYANDVTQKASGETLGVSKQRVSQIARRAIRRLRHLHRLETGEIRRPQRQADPTAAPLPEAAGEGQVCGWVRQEGVPGPNPVPGMQSENHGKKSGNLLTW